MSEERATQEMAPEPEPAPRERAIVRRAQRVPLPRRLIAMGLLFAVLALALHGLPRPWQPIPTRTVRAMSGAFTDLRGVYRGEAAALKPVTGEATADERTAYSRQLWRYAWLGAFREIILRFSEWGAGTCVLVALGMVVVQRRRDRRTAAASGARLEPTTLRRETLAGETLLDARRDPPRAEPVQRAAPLRDPESTPPRPTAKPELPPLQTEDTPPAPTPRPNLMELRPAAIPQESDDRPTGPVNLATLPVTAPARTASAPVTAAPAAPLFTKQTRERPVVHPGESPMSDATPAKPPVPDADPHREKTTKELPVPPDLVETKPESPSFREKPTAELPAVLAEPKPAEPERVTAELPPAVMPPEGASSLSDSAKSRTEAALDTAVKPATSPAPKPAAPDYGIFSAKPAPAPERAGDRTSGENALAQLLAPKMEPAKADAPKPLADFLDAVTPPKKDGEK